MVAEIVDTFGRGECSVVQETQVAMNRSENQGLIPSSMVVPCFSFGSLYHVFTTVHVVRMSTIPPTSLKAQRNNISQPNSP
jgi:hypothetical protein